MIDQELHIEDVIELYDEKVVLLKKEFVELCSIYTNSDTN